MIFQKYLPLESFSLRDLWVEAKKISFLEFVFLLLSIPMGIGFIYYGVEFAKIGIPISLPSGLGGIRNFQPAIFVTEIYILILFTLGTLAALKEGKVSWIYPKPHGDLLLLSVMFFLVLSFLRLLPDLPNNPILVIRNAAFAWYLLLSLLLAQLSIRMKVINFYFLLMIFFVFTYFVFTIFTSFINGRLEVNFLPTVGLCAPFAFALVSRSWLWSSIVFLFLAMGIGIDYWGKLQRTSLLGFFVTLLVLLLLQRIHLKRIFLRCLLFAGLIFLGVKAGEAGKFSLRLEFNGFSNSNLVKGSLSEGGMEAFRWEMWKDAFGLFKEHPLWGIGFERQVVYRIVGGRNAGLFAPNDSTTWGNPKDPPISGPHNSYLNALARLGIWGAILFIIHGVALWRLWFAGYFGGFFILLGQAVYASVNVGLEGPTRSFFLILAIGLALKVGPARRVGAEINA